METEGSPPKEDRDEKIDVLYGALRKLERLRRRDLLTSVAVSIAISLAFAWWTVPFMLLPLLRMPSQLLRNVFFLSDMVMFLDGLTVGLGGVLVIATIAVAAATSIHVLRARSHAKTAVPAPAMSNEAAAKAKPANEGTPVEGKPPQVQREKPDRGRLHILGVDAEVDPAVGRKLRRGIYAADRVHALVVGFPGSGKTRFLLSLIKQHIDHDEGFMVFDSHHDLAPLVLSHIPPEKWDRVVYINPWTAFEEKFGNRVVQINFLEYKDPRERDVTARLFMDSLEKLQERFWGPRLDMIMMNGLYLLMEKESATLPDLYKVIADEDYRERLLLRCRDDNVKSFWEREYKTMPRDAHDAVLTKVYRLVQERIVVPMFKAEKSTVDFREAMDQGKFVIVDLPEGRVTTDVTNFIGSLILGRVYMAGMSRDDTPEVERRPFYVYIDEAYRYTTKSIQDMLQSLRKYKVFVTLASQYLQQYRRDVQRAIPQTCETIVTFMVGAETANALAKFYPKEFGAKDLVNLPPHHFFVSTIFCGVRECQVLETIDPGFGPYNPDDVVRESLQNYGRYVDVDKLMGEVRAENRQKESLEALFGDWPVSPAEMAVLLTIKRAGGVIEHEKLLDELAREQFEHEKGMWIVGEKPPVRRVPILKEIWVENALRNLTNPSVKRENAWVKIKEEIRRPVEVKYFKFGEKKTRVLEVKTRVLSLVLADKKALPILAPSFKGDKAGDIPHIQTINALLRKQFWPNNWATWVDTGETAESVADIYVTPNKPAPGDDGLRGYIDPDNWDYERSFAVEVEMYPEKHWDRVKENYERNVKMGFPTEFVVPSVDLKGKLEEKLRSWGATVVENIAEFEPDNPKMAFVDVVPLEIAEKADEEAEGSERIPPEAFEVPGADIEFLRDMVKGLKGYTAVIKGTGKERKIIMRKTEGEKHVEGILPYSEAFKQIIEDEGIKVLDLEKRRNTIRELREKGVPVKVKDGWVVMGEAETQLFPYDEFTEQMLKEEGVVVEGAGTQQTTPEEKPKGTPTPSEKAKEEKTKGEEGKPQAGQDVKTPTEGTHEKPDKTEKSEEKKETIQIGQAKKPPKMKRGEGKGADKKTRIQQYVDRGFGFRVKVVDGKEYLVAFKWGETEHGLGRIDEETKRIVKELGINVKGL